VPGNKLKTLKLSRVVAMHHPEDDQMKMAMTLVQEQSKMMNGGIKYLD
jgi:hypothetical protein